MAWYRRDDNPLLHIDGLMQERYNSSAPAMELCLSCTNPPIVNGLQLPVNLHGFNPETFS